MKSTFLRRYCKKKIAVAAAIGLLIIIIAAIIGPVLCPYSPYEQNVENRLAGISKEHWLGTDYTGRDTFTRIIYGARISLTVSFAGVFAGMAIGVLLGLMAGYYGGFVDSVVSRLVELLMAFPGILLAIMIIAVLGSGENNVIYAAAVFVIPSFVRITRSSVMSLRNSGFVQSCYIIGASDRRIIFTHILPNILPMIIVNFTLNIGTAALMTASLSFLGFGVQPPAPEWGAMLSTGRSAMREYPLGVLAPGLAITAVVICTSLIGDGLRDALDVKMKNA